MLAYIKGSSRRRLNIQKIQKRLILLLGKSILEHYKLYKNYKINKEINLQENVKLGKQQSAGLVWERLRDLREVGNGRREADIY